MNINEYLDKYYNGKKVSKNGSFDINNITDIYQDLTENGIFISLNGKSTCKLNNIVEAIKRKPALIISDNKQKMPKIFKIPMLTVETPKIDLARLLKIENEKYGKMPSIIGITGTNGKTTTTYMLYLYLKSLNYDVLLIGTNWIYSYFKMEEIIEETNNTTPSLSLLYKYLRKTNNEYDYVIMEVSSQGIEEGRIEGLKFKVVGLTNLSSEHLDYHNTLTEYRVVKSKLLGQVEEPYDESSCILNADDENYDYYKSKCMSKLITFGINNGMIRAEIIKSSQSGNRFMINDRNTKYYINTNLIGIFNIYNILMIWCINNALKIRRENLVEFLNNKHEVPGRMQVIKKNNRTFIIDFAHTIDAVENVLKTINKVKKDNHIITVIGCGGMRDRIKRPIIGKIVTEYSDYVVFTEDNSRDENTTDIIEEITKDLTKSNYCIKLDREDAVNEAYKLSVNNDIILLLGKGIEKYQIRRNNQKIPYSEINTINNLGNNYEYL